MYCTKCKYTSFDSLESCPKCNTSWEEDRKFFNLTWIEQNKEGWTVRSSEVAEQPQGAESADIDADEAFMQEVDLDEGGLFMDEPGSGDLSTEDEEELFAAQDEEDSPDTKAGAAPGSAKDFQAEGLFEEEETIEVETSTADMDSFSIPELDAMFGPEDSADQQLAEDAFADLPETAEDDYASLSRELDLDEVEELDERPVTSREPSSREKEPEFDTDNLLDSIELDLEEDES